MEKRSLMHLAFRILITAFLIQIGVAQIRGPLTADRKKNIESFSLTAVTKQQSASDSINVIIYMQIPNYALQFVKSDTGFIANYEATISFYGKKDRQIGRTFWQDSVIISNYEETIARLKGITLATNFNVAPREYKYSASLYDLDTKNTGEFDAKLNLSKYSNKVTLHPPLLLVNQEGEWGFGKNKIPSFFNSADEISNGLLIYISGKCAPGAYSLNYEVFSNDDEPRWGNSFSDTSKTGWFEKYLEIPADAFNEITSNLKVTINQSGKSDSKTSRISIRHPGISHLITDIEKALDQMTYILTSQEKAKLKRQSKKQKEKLFKEYWDSRDPTPGTVSNELMEEYYKRVAYTNEHFTGIAGGWKSDMGMIYIIFGVPEDIERSVMAQSHGNFEIWYYYRISRSFIFEDRDGLGYYRLTTPFYGEPF